MQLSTEILQAMMHGANPIFLVGLIAMHGREPLAVETALREASNCFYNELEKKNEHQQIIDKVRIKSNGDYNKRIRERLARSGKNVPR